MKTEGNKILGATPLIMEKKILESPDTFCRTCLKAESGLDKLQSIHDSDPTMIDNNLTYSEMLQSFTNRVVS